MSFFFILRIQWIISYSPHIHSFRLFKQALLPSPPASQQSAVTTHTFVIHVHISYVAPPAIRFSRRILFMQSSQVEMNIPMWIVKPGETADNSWIKIQNYRAEFSFQFCDNLFSGISFPNNWFVTLAVMNLSPHPKSRVHDISYIRQIQGSPSDSHNNHKWIKVDTSSWINVHLSAFDSNMLFVLRFVCSSDDAIGGLASITLIKWNENCLPNIILVDKHHNNTRLGLVP